MFCRLKKRLAKEEKKIEVFGYDVTIKDIPDSKIAGDMDKRELKLLLDEIKNKDKKVFSLESFRNEFSGMSKLRNHKKIVQEQYVINIDKRNFKVYSYVQKSRQKKENLTPIVCFHGGSWIGGSCKDNLDACKLLALSGDFKVFNVEYSLAPEHPFPCGVEDCVKAYEFVLKNHKKLGCSDNIVLCGDSAGGTLAAATSNLVAKKPILQILWYPCTSIDYQNMPFDWREDDYEILEEYKQYVFPKFILGRTDGKLDTKMMTSLFYLYLNGYDKLADPRLSPIYGDKNKFPPTLLFSAEFDALRQQTEYFNKSLKDANVDCKCIRYRGICHGFISKCGVLPQADDSVCEAVKAINKVLKGERL